VPESKERPICRRKIEQMLAERRCKLEDLLELPRHKLSPGLRKQLRKMIVEAAPGGTNVRLGRRQRELIERLVALEGRDPSGIPTLRAVPARGGLKVWCRYCRSWHNHGPGAGHRVAHCADPLNPYYRSGYILVPYCEGQEGRT